MSVNELVNRVVMTDILSQPTAESKIKPNNPSESFVKPEPSKTDFHIPEGAREITAPIQSPLESAESIEVEELDEEIEQSSEESAEALIDMIDVVQKSLFIFLASRKIKRNIPEKLMEEFINIDIKDMQGKPLTEDEQKKLERYKAFEHRLNRVAKEMPFTKEEREDLMNCTKALVKKTGMRIPPGVWFGAHIASALSKRVIDVAMTA